MNINKILITFWVLVTVYLWMHLYFYDIWTIPSIKNEALRAKIAEKTANITEFDLNEYNIGKESYKKLHDYISSFYKSSILNIDEDGILYFATNTHNTASENLILNHIKRELESFNTKKDEYIYYVPYTYDFLKDVVDEKYNFEISEWKLFFDIWKPNNKVVFSLKEMSKMFNEDSIKWLKSWEYYYWDNIYPYAFRDLAWIKYPKNTLYKMKYIGKEYVKWFDITDTKYPIISIFKQKKEWTGIIVDKFNAKKKIEIENAFNNITDYIKSKELLFTLTDDKSTAKLNENIYNFTELTELEYYNLFLKHKWLEIVRQKENVLLLENEYWYYILYFDKEKEYKFDVNVLTVTWYKYSFIIETFIRTKVILTERLLNELNKDIVANWYNELIGERIKVFWNMLSF